MILKRLKLKDFRQFQGSSNILDFTPNKNGHITLVFASNGVGKTTILSAIVWCLYGGNEIQYGDQKNVFLNKNTFDSLPDNGETTVEVILSFEDRGDDYIVKRSLVVRKLDNQQKNISFNELEVTINDKPQHNGQARIDDVLSNKMHGYFFFKGEGVGKYAEEDKSNLVQQGIKNIMKIDTREKALKLMESTRKQFEKDAATLQKKLGEKDVPEQKKKEIEERIEQIDEEINDLEKKVIIFDELIKDNESSLLKVHSTKHLADQANNIKASINDINSEKKLIESKLEALISQSSYLALSEEVFDTSNSILEGKRKNGELPIIGIAKDFISDIIDKKICICGTHFSDDDEQYENLIEIRDNTTAKSNIEATVSTLGVFIESKKDFKMQFEKEFYEYINSISQKENELTKLDSKLEAIEEKIQKELPEEENLIKKKKEHIAGKEKSIGQLGIIRDEKERLLKELRDIQKTIDNASSSNHELQLARERATFCENAIDLLKEENDQVIEEIRLELTKRLKQRFEELLHSNKTADLDEDFKLRILENGKPTAKSDGEDKLISLIFISTLIDMAREREKQSRNDGTDPGAGIYPIVIDSPYGEFDSVYKKNISEAVKSLAPQVIILMNQEQWNNGKDIGPIFKDNISNAYALVAHRPKLDILQGDKNTLSMSIDNPLQIELEVQDDKEFTTIERIGE